METAQNKTSEIAFFDNHAAADEYNVFTDAANDKIIDQFVALTGLPPGSKVVDLGCGSGIFTSLLAKRGYIASGVDLSPKLIELARSQYPGIAFHVGDIEALDFADGSFDGVMLSGVVHHIPDARLCAREVARILRPGGAFYAFDPNRRHPFMYLYRDRSSPFYSNVGVTENERPVIAAQVAAVFRGAGLETRTAYLGGLAYRYIASKAARVILPAFNLVDAIWSAIPFLAPARSFVLTHGFKAGDGTRPAA